MTQNFHMPVKSRKASKGGRHHTLNIPTSVAQNLPDHVEWDLSITETGLVLTYMGEYTPDRSERSVPTVETPFIK